jgi:hypothetical protein
MSSTEIGKYYSVVYSAIDSSGKKVFGAMKVFDYSEKDAITSAKKELE